MNTDRASGWVLSLALLAIIGPAGCGDKSAEESRRVEAKNSPDIILISIDTLRSDRLGAYGYARDTSPFMDSIAGDGILFKNAFSTSSWTAPAMVSLMTSRYPYAHGVVHGLVAKGRVEHQEAIPGDLPLVAERLRAAGYTTFGISSNRHLSSELGFGRGFDHYECIGFANAATVLDRVKNLRSKLNAARPYFLWVHFLDPHAPYNQRQPYFDSYWGDRPIHEDLITIKRAKRYEKMDLQFGNEGAEFVNALYDSEIRYTDEATRKLFAMVPRSKDAAVIVTSDHGEEFAEHGRYGHGHSLYNGVVKVPMIMRLPNKRLAGTSTTDRVSLVDVPTTLAIIGKTAVPGGWKGRDMIKIAEGKDKNARNLYLSLSRNRELRSVLEDRYKYIYDLRKPDKSSLFNLKADPGEMNNVAVTDSKRATRLKNALIDRLLSMESIAHKPGMAEISDEHIEQLRALGYVD